MHESPNTEHPFNLTYGFAGAIARSWADTRTALAKRPLWERCVHIFWLSGPLILLIERSPADLWLSLIALIFLVKTIFSRQTHFLKEVWVKAAFLFLFCCLVSAATSDLPMYSIGETIAWFRFPLFAMAVVFWLGRDRRMLHAMLGIMTVGMMLMGIILALEIVLVGQQNGRLSWPYGDLVPGNYLAKACLPAFVVLVAIATSAGKQHAWLSGIFVILSLFSSLMTGERINFLIRICGGLLAAIVWRPVWSRVGLLVLLSGVVVVVTMFLKPDLGVRFVSYFITQLPLSSTSGYFQAMAPSWLAFQQDPILGIGPANLRFLCGELIGESSVFTCHPHPHNFYLQMLGEAGIIGFLTGVFFLGSVIWACARPALRDRSNVVIATMWIVPFGFFWPIASSADFFGQWNNVFMWSAVAVALAGAQIGSQVRSDTKT